MAVGLFWEFVPMNLLLCRKLNDPRQSQRLIPVSPSKGPLEVP
jgi:hypothetical protein